MILDKSDKEHPYIIMLNKSYERRSKQKKSLSINIDKSQFFSLKKLLKSFISK